MKSIRKNYHMLAFLQKANPSQRRAILKTLTGSQLNCICEICLNTLNGNVGKANISKLKKYKTVIRKLADKKVSDTVKKQLLTNQTGGAFLPYLIPTVISALGSLFQR